MPGVGEWLTKKAKAREPPKRHSFEAVWEEDITFWECSGGCGNRYFQWGSVILASQRVCQERKL